MTSRNLNFTYRLVWSDVQHMFIAVAECARTRKKRSGAVVLAAALLAAPFTTLAQTQSLPTGGQVVAGQGHITSAGSTMTVTQNTTNMAVNWQSFSIGQGNTVNFVQPSTSAVALNRVLGSDVSVIQGALNANGKIFLINPNGVLFTPTAQVNVGSLVASTLNISTNDFMAGNYRFEGASSNAITNQGNIMTANGGTVALIAAKIVNTGQITAPQGQVLMGAGSTVTLDLGGPVKIQVDEGVLNALIEQGGGIRADGGLVYLTAKAAGELASSVINHTGITEANSLTEKGGQIVLEGDRIQLADGSRLAATGATSGGEVLVGGGWQGSGTIRQATTVTLAQGATIDVSATQAGDGGTAVLWSDIHNPLSQTRAYGTIWAKGGAESGNGGRIETSGHWLDVAGSQGGASATNGQAGLWLFDPYNVTITGANAGGAWGGGNPDTWTPSADNSTILNTDINSKLEGGTNVTITTGAAGSQNGDITVASAITKNAGNTDVTLTLQAANSIVVDQAISNTGGSGKLNVLLDADNDNGVRDGAGIVMLNNSISTGGGSLNFGTGATHPINGVNTLVGGDVFVGGSSALTLSTNGGAVNVKGEMIIANTNGLTINSNGGNVRFYGLLNSGNQYTFVDKTGSAGFGTWAEARTEAINGTGGGGAVNDSYLVTITSRLENAVAVRTSGYKGAWIGAYRPNEATGAWVWADGPEASQQFFTQTTNGSGGVTASGYYANFGTGEPNGSMAVFPAERVGQFFGTTGQWNDLPVAETYVKASAAPQYQVHGFVRETNLAASPLTVNAGTGTVTFSGAVGTSKALASLNVVSTGGIAINGGAVTTEGTQTYNGNVTLDAPSTTLTQTNANTDFTVQSGKTITNATGSDATLTIKTTGNIAMDANTAISSSSGKLNTILWSDADNSGSGYIFIHDGNTISTNGGDIVMAGGLDDGANGGSASDGIPDGYAVSTVATASGVSIGRNANAATAATTITSGGGNILMRGKSTGANPSMGIHYAYGGTLDAGSGTLTMLGEANSYAGIELSAWLDGAGTSYLDITAGTVEIRGITSSAGHHGLASSQLNNEYTRITAGAGGITLYGHNTVNTAKGVEISLNASTTGGGNITVESPNYVAIYGGANAHSFNAGTGSTTLRSNTLSIGANHTFNGTGTLTVEPYTAGRTINIGTSPAGALNIASSYFSSNFADGFSGITIGNATAGAITVGGATTFRDDTTLRNNAAIAINGALTANEDLTLIGNGALSQTAALSVTGTTAITAGAANNITLTNASNNFTGAVSVVTGNNVAIVDSNALTLGAINASGAVDIATLAGDLTLTNLVTTTHATADAVSLNAGKSTAAGTATGGNILLSGGSVSTGAGGTAKLFSGSLSASTGLATLVGSGSGNFRYNADETTDFSAGDWTALATGLHAIYREQPTLTVTASDASKTHDGVAYSGGNGVTSSGLINGDTAASALGGTLTYGGTSQGATAAGTYSITPGGYSSRLGYALAYVDGTLTISAAPPPTSSEPQQAAVQTAQVLPPSNTPAPPGAPGNTPLTPQAPTPGASGGLEFVDVPSGGDGGVIPPTALPPEGGAQTLAGNVRVFVEDGGIRLPTGNKRR